MEPLTIGVLIVSTKKSEVAEFGETTLVASDRRTTGYPTSTSTSTSVSSAAPTCSAAPSTLHLKSSPYENFFISDCHSSGQVVVTSPAEGDDFTVIAPRLLFAWPAGNSGAALLFVPDNGINGSLTIEAVNSSTGTPLGPIYNPAPAGAKNQNASYGISTQVKLNSTARLNVAILGSIRTIRDYVEGPSILRPEIQSALKFTENANGGVTISRLWLDNTTTTTVVFSPTSNDIKAKVENQTVTFAAGTWAVNASFNYPQPTQLGDKQVLRPESYDLIEQNATLVESLAFLSYTDKLLAGAWRFLTYFGRDSMIATLLMEPILSQGKGGAIEAVIAAVLDRVNSSDGSVCHEETIGDYSTWQNLREGIPSTAPQCDYKMIDTDFYLPILMNQYFVLNPNGSARTSDFMKTGATFFPKDANLTYGDMALKTAERIMNKAAPFASNQSVENLIHLKDHQSVGQWRDSGSGLGGGRIPFDVNTALVPAALRAIGSLSRHGFFNHSDWKETADAYAKVWEDKTLDFFAVTVPESNAKDLLKAYVNASSFPGSDQSGAIDGDVDFYALALDGSHNQAKVKVMHSDTAFRLFLINDTDDTQLSAFINDTAKSIIRTFPAGLLTDVGMLVANPAFTGVASDAKTFGTNAYHGTVVWGWQLAMMARGLELQLSRCSGNSGSASAAPPAFCSDKATYGNAITAYNKLWDVIEANSEHLSNEVWSWTYGDNKFKYIELGALPPPPGSNPVESDIVQLWSLTFLAVKRNGKFQGS